MKRLGSDNAALFPALAAIPFIAWLFIAGVVLLILFWFLATAIVGAVLVLAGLVILATKYGAQIPMPFRMYLAAVLILIGAAMVYFR